MNLKGLTAGVAALAALTAVAAPAGAVHIRTGFDAGTLGRTDDGSSNLTSLGFTALLGTSSYTGLYVNNNGNVTFAEPQPSFRLPTLDDLGLPSGLRDLGTPILAPFFADVDTRGAASGVASFGGGRVDGRTAFGVTWSNVGYYASRTDKTNLFQLVMIDRNDTGTGNFDFEFNYGRIAWESGELSGGTNGLGGNCAQAGFAFGDGTSVELPGSGICGALLDGGPNALWTSSNVGIAGRFLYSVRGGQVGNASVPVPEPGTLALLALGLLGVARGRRRV